MRTIVRVERLDSSGYKLKPLTMTEQVNVDELVQGFLELDLEKQQLILNIIDAVL